MNEVKPAIVVVGYNRPKSISRLLKSISCADYKDSGVTLIISIDKSDISDKVVKVAKEFSWVHGKKIIRTFNTRQGLRNHVLQCGDLSLQYGAVIVLEDDLVVSPTYYTYTQKVEYYKNDDRVVGVSLYSHQWNEYANRFPPCPIWQ